MISHLRGKDLGILTLARNVLQDLVSSIQARKQEEPQKVAIAPKCEPLSNALLANSLPNEGTLRNLLSRFPRQVHDQNCKDKTGLSGSDEENRCVLLDL